MSKFTRIIAGTAAATSLFMSAGVALAAGHVPHAVPTAPGQNKITCFDGTSDGGFGGVCTIKSNGAKGTATLNNTDSNPAGDYAGVYTASSTLNGQMLSQVTQLGYTYSGTTAPQPGNLSLNVPVSVTGSGTTDGYAFIDAYYCPGVNGTVDAINDPNCAIWFLGTEYPNWAALVAAYPDATVATDNLAFVIAERTPAEGPMLWTISNLTLGKPGK
jgi:hypothetical protein